MTRDQRIDWIMSECARTAIDKVVHDKAGTLSAEALGGAAWRLELNDDEVAW